MTTFMTQLMNSARLALAHTLTLSTSIAQTAIGNRVQIAKNAMLTLVATSVFSTFALPQYSHAAPIEARMKNAPLNMEVEQYTKLLALTEPMSKKRVELSPTFADIRAQLALAEAEKAAEQKRVADEAARVAKKATAVATQPTKSNASNTQPPHIQAPQITGGRVFNVTVTAYNSEAGQTDSSPDITASGSRTRDGVIAINGLPFGAKVKLPQYFGDKIFTVEDRTSSRYGKLSRADIWMLRKTDALKWGIKRNVQLVVVQ